MPDKASQDGKSDGEEHEEKRTDGSAGCWLSRASGLCAGSHLRRWPVLRIGLDAGLDAPVTLEVTGGSHAGGSHTGRELREEDYRSKGGSWVEARQRWESRYNGVVQKFYDNPQTYEAPAGVRVAARLKIAQVEIAPATVLAPMAGITDTVFRRFIRRDGWMRSADDGVHLRRWRGAEEGQEGEALSALLCGRTSDLVAAVRFQSRVAGRGGTDGGRVWLRSGGSEPGMPGEEGGEVQRREWTVARAAGDSEDLRIDSRRSSRFRSR